ncbi:hypothetical protein Slin15195_G051350 [Septoria linicola]|uniref:Uncharacterized protein n=1 Tax=Septoria linicola TaxID=215465 RepID=A0A9Q9ATT7_9PEZI|nr:hypothetical protein Slin15195_G051350 [Septoria linicola]
MLSSDLIAVLVHKLQGAIIHRDIYPRLWGAIDDEEPIYGTSIDNSLLEDDTAQSSGKDRRHRGAARR